MGKQTACPERSVCGPQSPPSRACTACRAPAREVRPLSPRACPPARAWRSISPPIVLLLALQAVPGVLHCVFVLLACFRSPRPTLPAPARNCVAVCLPWALSFRIAPRPFLSRRRRAPATENSSSTSTTADRKSSRPKLQSLAPLDNHAIGALVLTRLLAECRESPRRHRVVALDTALTAAVRVIYRVHGYAANRRTNALPARASSLAESLILVVHVADLSDRRTAVHREL